MAAATHERGLAEERARLATEGVAGLEQRLERLREEGERLRGEGERLREDAERAAAQSEEAAERAAAQSRDAAEQAAAQSEQAIEGLSGELDEARQALQSAGEELAAARSRLEAREQHLENAKAGIESRDRRLEVADERMQAADERAQAADERARERDEELKAVVAALEAERTELATARERIVAREREVDAAGTLLEAQGAELARAREEAREAREAVQEARAEADASARELSETRERLAKREQHLRTAQLGVESRDRRLATAEGRAERSGKALESRDAELERLRVVVRDRDRSLALAEARLEKARQRAETFKGSLVEIRSGRAYRLMRILWRLRRPFRRAPKQAGEGEAGGGPEDAEPAPPAEPTAPLATSSRIAGKTRQPGERLRVASILDEMSEACFAPECELVPLTLEGWREQLDQRPPDLLLVESAWNGNGGEWQYRIATYPRKDLAGLPALRGLLEGCRERGIPTAFWNKEDPVHFDRFAEAAALFDHVFTTDARCVERYRELPGRAGAAERTVEALPFAAQPRIHNPAAVVPERSTSPCFAGAWYRDRHPERRRSLAALLDAARPRGLVIYDRSFGGKDGAFGFPERFAPHVLGKLPYERILDVYKSHRVFLNANSVADSPTMCSRRVFELAACDTAILSTPGTALEALLGAGMVAEAADEESATAALERLLGDEGERRRRTRAARRRVFAEHTYAERLATIARAAGIEMPQDDGERWQLLVQPGIELTAEAEADLRAAAVFAEADAIGVGAANGRPAPEHRRVDELDPRALLLSRDLLNARGPLDSDPDQIAAQLRRWSDNGTRLYAADADLLALGASQHVA